MSHHPVTCDSCEQVFGQYDRFSQEESVLRCSRYIKNPKTGARDIPAMHECYPCEAGFFLCSFFLQPRCNHIFLIQPFLPPENSDEYVRTDGPSWVGEIAQGTPRFSIQVIFWLKEKKAIGNFKCLSLLQESQDRIFIIFSVMFISENLELSQCIAVITFTMNPCFLMFSAFALFSNRIRKSKIEFRKSTRAGKSVEERTVARKGCWIPSLTSLCTRPNPRTQTCARNSSGSR